MPSPSLLLKVADQTVKKQLQQSDIFNAFDIVLPQSADAWIPELHDFAGPVAIIELNEFNETDLSELTAKSTLASKDVVFITNGEPNPFIDKAMRNGASYHLRMPLEIGFLNDLLQEIFQESADHDADTVPGVSSELDQFGLLVGSSNVMRKLYRTIRKAADSSANIFVVGESGAGKELVANTIHLMSPHSEKPFVAINCGALSPELIESELFGHVKGAFTGANKDRAGVFEQAEGGTLFLDEVTEMPLEHQVKLLRVLETGEYRPVGSDKTKFANVRVISATNREPAEAIEAELFREDLYFRLAHFPIRVPPLRDRGKDIVGLAKHFLAYRNAEEQQSREITKDALDKISCYHWPGNVRELKHTIERAYILADGPIDEAHLIFQEIANEEKPDYTLPAGIPLEEVEKGVIMKTLAQNDGNKTETASQLGVSVKTLYNKLEKYEESE